MPQAMAETLESAARMAMAPPLEENRFKRNSPSHWGLVYAFYAAFLAMLLIGAAAVLSV